MYQNDLLIKGGAENVAAGLEDDYWAEISYEQLITWNPDVIIVVPAATYTVEDILGDKQLSDVSAVKEGKVYQMPEALNLGILRCPDPFSGACGWPVCFIRMLTARKILKRILLNFIKPFMASRLM